MVENKTDVSQSEVPAPGDPTLAKRPPKFSLVPLSVVLLITLAGIGMLLQIQRSTVDPGERIPNRYIFVPQFSGKVKITYNVPDAPELPVEDGVRIVEVPPSGLLETSSPILYGTAHDEFYRRMMGGGEERLTVQHIKMRKNGITGDRNEFFTSPNELEERDRWMEMMGFEYDDSEGGLRYELIEIRDDF